MEKSKHEIIAEIKNKEGINSKVSVQFYDSNDRFFDIDSAAKLTKTILTDIKKYKQYFYKKEVSASIKEMGTGPDSWIPINNKLDDFIKKVKVSLILFLTDSIEIRFTDPDNYVDKPQNLKPSSTWYYDHVMSVECDIKGKPVAARVEG